MKTRLGLVPLFLTAVAACATSGESGAPLDSSGNPPTSGGANEAPSCVATCSAPGDCAIQGSPLNDASHFACTAGRCEWKGCKSTAECTSALQSSKLVCAAPSPGVAPDCLPTCTAAADCAVPGVTLYDASHFACTGGRCEWQGCKSTADCTGGAPNAKLACAKAPGAPFADCVPTCSAAADCAAPGNALYSASHFACVAGKCEWKGCKSTAECTSALQSSKLVCE